MLAVAEKLAEKCEIAPPTPASGISVRFISSLYTRICLPYLEESAVFPDIATSPKEHLTTILDSLSCDFLHLDLDRLIRVEDILSGNEESIFLLLRIFDNLYDCLCDPATSDGDTPFVSGESSTPSTSLPQQRDVSQPHLSGPRYMGQRIIDLRSASVIYSPRTEALKRLKRSRNIDRKKTYSMEPVADRSARKFEKISAVVPGKEITGSNHSVLLGKPSAADKRQMRIAVERAKAYFRNTVAERRHVMAMTKRTMDELLLKAVSNDMKLEMAKEKGREALQKRNIAQRNEDLFLLRGSGERKAYFLQLAQERARKCSEIGSLLSQLQSNLMC